MSGDFDSQVAGVAALNDPIRRRLYDFVVQNAEPVSRDQAAEAAGIQRPLAAFHLDKLADEGLLDVEFKRLSGRSGPGAGRPAKLYRRSDREIAVSLPPREYDLAARLLAEAVEKAGPQGNVRKALERAAFNFGKSVGEEAEQRAGSRPSAARRREALLDALVEHGFEPRVVGDQLVLGNCPFHALAEQFRDLVCGMNLHLMEGVRSAMSFRDDRFEPELAPEAGLCCVRFCRVA
jgi:predicted ArsR family transcriptional regulator